jgi:hypothetical protein
MIFMSIIRFVDNKVKTWNLKIWLNAYFYVKKIFNCIWQCLKDINLSEQIYTLLYIYIME